MSAPEQIVHFIEKIILSQGYDLVDLVIKGSGSTQTIRCFVDRTGGVTIDDCTALNRLLVNQVDPIYEELGLTLSRLEVSSPGTDRPFQDKKDYKRNIGQKINVEYKEGGGIQKVVGILLSVDDQQITIQTTTGDMSIKLDTINIVNVYTKW
jgi:ribosome maturation factor RimP